MNRVHWKMAVGTALLSLCACAAFGQAPDGPPPGPPPDQAGQGERRSDPERELKMLTHLLTLTADQQTGVKSVLEQQREQLKALRNKTQAASESATAGSDSRESRQVRRSQVQAIFDETDTKITALLDENQKKTFAQWTAQRNATREQRRSPDGGDGPPPPPPNEV
jgi:protein CpxP